ncbi:MAG: DUF1778 domain-containing protein [Candidatus Omnitrophota bacterium]|jgi:uncharacterized protein (DUF1778 family)|nr:MAG: DUF1778 domain-containing protein [Candidatus Omnitrophota bacterium]
MPNMETSKEITKTAFLNIRINEHQKDLISQAATLRKLSLSEFVIENAYDAATQVLADKTQFVLSPEKWEEFCDALDAPPKSIPALKELLNKPSAFNER